jgi:GH25 family lysozyme M1 (1,4-beta-N-acetylmuramidase)
MTKHRGTVVDGAVHLDSNTEWLIAVAKLNGKRVMVTIGRDALKRSDPQNRYFHGVIIPILADHTGYTEEEMKDALKWKFLRSGTDDLPTVKGTSDLNTVEMEALNTRIREWASADLGCYIPLPNEKPSTIKVA